jgi:hypothetical protein
MNDDHNSLGKAMLPQYQSGIILRKFRDDARGVWCVGIGARSIGQDGKVTETVIGLSYQEAETVVRSLIGILDGFEPHQKIVRRPL